MYSVGLLWNDVLFALVFVIVYVIYRVISSSNKKYPPGPIGLPIVGYAPFLQKKAYLQFIELGKKYGDIFSLRLGSQNVVVLNSSGAIQEAFAKPEFQGRPPHNAFSILGRASPFFVSGNEVWAEHRRFIMQSMKQLGLGKTSIETQIQDEVSCFINELRSYDGNPCDPSLPLMPSISNNICSLVFNQRYDYRDPERIKLDQNLMLTSEILAQTSSHIFFPWLQRLPFYMKFMGFEKGRRAYKETKRIFEEKIKQHEETLDPKNIRDFIDSYLVEMKSRKEKAISTTLSDKFLVGSVEDLFGAGSETVRTTILWYIYVLAAYPAVQKRVREEILTHLGPDRRPEFKDMMDMPYSQAVIMEVMRWKSILPLNILRYTTDESTVGGFAIPRGSTVVANFWAAHHDARLWTRPGEFLPERFLAEDGLSVEKSPNFMPFSLGKRICPGEKMAKIQLFLYFVSIFQNFDVSFPEGFEPTFDAELAVSFRLNPYLVHLTPKK